MMDEQSFSLEINKQLENKKIDYAQAQDLLYEVTNKKKRFQVFIALYDATLKTTHNLAAEVFREAYCASDNIYNQIKSSSIFFNIKSFLKSIQAQGVDFIKLLNDDEKKFYNGLPNQLRIYRGMCDAEHESKDYGISWSISEEEAKLYAYFYQNDVEVGKGGVVCLDICKDDIITVYSVHTAEKIMHEVIYVIK